jgi:hypothetical protein
MKLQKVTCPEPFKLRTDVIQYNLFIDHFKVVYILLLLLFAGRVLDYDILLWNINVAKGKG